MGAEKHARGIASFIKEQIDVEIPSQLRYVDPLVSYLVGHLLDLGLIDNESNFNVALHEAITNAIRHGNGMDSSKMVRVTVDLNKERAVFTIMDEGGGFDPTCVCDPTVEENLFHHSGRGLLLIRHLVDEVRYNSAGNEITMVLRSPGTATS